MSEVFPTEKAISCLRLYIAIQREALRNSEELLASFGAGEELTDEEYQEFRSMLSAVGIDERS